MRREDEVPKRLVGMHGGELHSASFSSWSKHARHSSRQRWLSIPPRAIMHGDAMGSIWTHWLKGDSGEGGDS